MNRLWSLFHFFVQTLSILQRIPFLILASLWLGLCFLTYKVFRWHRLWVFALKSTIRCFFFLNAIRIKIDTKSIKEPVKKWAEAAVISNGYQAVDALILYLVLPYHSLVFVDPHYFAGSKILKTLLHQGGFYPREAQFDFQLFRKQDFIGDPYAKSGFLLGELVRPERQNYEPIPYVLMLAIKHSLSIHCLLIKGSEKIPYATWLTPVRIEVSLIQSILPNKRLESTIAQYRFIITKMMDYERSRRSFKKERYPGSSYSTIPGQATPPRQSPDSNPPETEDQKDPEAE